MSAQTGAAGQRVAERVAERVAADTCMRVIARTRDAVYLRLPAVLHLRTQMFRGVTVLTTEGTGRSGR